MSTWILSALEEGGHKLTKPRKAIAAWIAAKKGMFTASEIIQALPKIDRVSVYRTLDLFADLDLIHPTMTRDGEQYYEAHEVNHHHHVLCEGCEKTACIPCTLPEAVVRGFTNLHHSLTFTGLCTACAR